MGNILLVEKIPVDISFSSEYIVGLSGSLTQSVEYLTFNQRVARSSRARPTSFCPHRLARFRTSAFHADNTGSNPVGDAKKAKDPKMDLGFFFCLIVRFYLLQDEIRTARSFHQRSQLPLRTSDFSLQSFTWPPVHSHLAILLTSNSGKIAQCLLRHYRSMPPPSLR